MAEEISMEEYKRAYREVIREKEKSFYNRPKNANKRGNLKMKLHLLKGIFSLLFVLSIVIASSFVPYAFAATPPPPPEYEVEIESEAAVIVEEAAPDTNFNSMQELMRLRVGIYPEFCYKEWSLIRFDHIIETDGGPLPGDADITDAKIKLYKETEAGGDVAIYKLQNRKFEENAVTWNTMPYAGVSPLSIQHLPAPSGWYYLDLPTWVVQGWISPPEASYGIALAPDWTECGQSITFRSDEYLGYAPTLVLSYRGEPPPPSAPIPPPPPPDTIPCEITYSVTPSNPNVGDLVTLTATATDNQAMLYICIERGLIELARQNATTSDQTELQVSYTQEATLPNLRFIIMADDLGDPSAQRLDIVVPVTGTGTVPEVTFTADWLDVEEGIPERYQHRLISGDGQRIRITATASDPDGIRHLTIFTNIVPHDFHYYDDETRVSETVTWTNDDPDMTRFYYEASVQDAELNYVTVEGESFDMFLPGTCDDGVQNQGEEDIDCGWPCDEPCDLCSASGLPDSFDWRDYRGRDWMTAVKDQTFPRSCGSCWAFTAVGVVEAKYNIQRYGTDIGIGEPIDHSEDLNLAEQHLVSNYYLGGNCGGGGPRGALYEIRTDGIPDEDCFPYEARNTGRRACDDWKDRAWTIGERVDAYRCSEDINDVKRTIICHGPITTCGDGHCVVVVGWNNTLGGWIIKNSWGVGWDNQAGATHIGGGYGFIPWDHPWWSDAEHCLKYYVTNVGRN